MINFLAQELINIFVSSFVDMSTPFSTMRVMKPVAAIITLSISFFTESWSTLGQERFLNTRHDVLLTTLVAAGGLLLSTLKVCAPSPPK